MRGIVDHAQRDRLDGWTGESGGDVGNARLARVGIDGHRDESVDQRDRVGARLLRDVGHLRDAAHVRRKLDDQGASSNSLRSSHHLIKGARIAAELQAAVGSVRAGNVQFVGGNALAIIENLDSSFIILARIAEDVRENYDVLDLPKPGQFLLEKRRCPNVLQADGIEHTGGSFPQPWRRIADHRFSREALDDEASELVEVNHILELDAVAEGTAGRNNWILQENSSDAHAQIQRRLAIVGRGGHRGALSVSDSVAAAPFSGCGVGASASVSTRPTAWEGALIPSSEANVVAMSIGSACVR